MNEVSIIDKGYTILFIADYEKASLKWKQFVDTIVNNLLNKPAVSDGGWIKFTNLPKIKVAVLDIAQTRDQAFTKLKESRYDVVFVNNYLDGKPIGGGMLKRFKQFHPDAIFIPLLDMSQKKGARRRDGEICNGEGIQNIFNGGFFNGVYKNNLNMSYVIKMIHAGGRPKENALHYYGLAAETELEDKGVVNANRPASEQPSVTESLATQQNAPVSQPSPVGGASTANSVDMASNGGNEENGVSTTNPMNTVTERQDNLSDQRASAFQGASTVVPSQPVQAAASSDTANNTTKESGQVSAEKRLNRRERRRLEQERKQKEQEERDRLQLNNYSTSSEIPAMYNNMESSDSAEPGEISAYQKSADPQLEEMRDIMRQRGQLNAGLVVPGTLLGKVMFAKGNTVWIELDKSLEQVGLNFADIYNMPVSIPYTKFGGYPMEE